MTSFSFVKIFMLYLGFGIEDTEKTKTKRGWRQRRKNVAKLATV
jgi:hypothetical protein